MSTPAMACRKDRMVFGPYELRDNVCPIAGCNEPLIALDYSIARYIATFWEHGLDIEHCCGGHEDIGGWQDVVTQPPYVMFKFSSKEHAMYFVQTFFAYNNIFLRYDGSSEETLPDHFIEERGPDHVAQPVMGLHKTTHWVVCTRTDNPVVTGVYYRWFYKFLDMMLDVIRRPEYKSGTFIQLENASVPPFRFNKTR